MSIESVMLPTISPSAAKTPHKKDPVWLCFPCTTSAELGNTWRSNLGNWSPEKGSTWPRITPLLVAKPAIDPRHAECHLILFHWTCSLHKYQVSTLSPWYFYYEAKRRNRIIFTFTSLLTIQFSSVQSLSHVRLFATPWTVACQASPSITNSQSLLKFKSIKLVIPSNHLILCHPLLLLPSIFPSIRVFSNESVLRIRWPKYWNFSVSISPFYEVSGLIISWLFGSPCSPRDSKESSPTPQFKSINSSALCLLYGPTLTSIYDWWKNHSFDYMNRCWQSDVSAF